MFKLLGQAQEKLPISENLFKCENATFIDIHSSVNFMTKEVTFKGKVEFEVEGNEGTTKGAQCFEGKSIPEVYNKIIDFCSNL